MTEDQLKKLAEEFDLSLVELMEKQAEGWKVTRGPFEISNGDTVELIQWYRYYERDEVDVVCDFNNFNDKEQIIITPNPTSSFINVILFSYFSGQDLSKIPDFYPPIKVDCQLIFNERIIRQWSIKNYRYTTETIPEEYLKEGGSYALVCNFTGPRGCTASASASFMVIKR